MSEQSTPPRPKPGSLRDRIAAFEKPASGQAAGPPAPVPRPKPAGISWKPKPPSPPSSPLISDSSDKKPSGMSASDAKESIGKGGSLKDRMAALQNRGAFGAPPPIAPKPPLEKPKWKPPPPVVAPVTAKDDDEEQSRAEVPRSPPLVRKSTSDGSIDEAPEEAPMPVDEGEEHEADPEEEERRRRANIAARMARLGGTRVGMAPPIFGQKPTTKRSESVSESMKSETLGEEVEETTSTGIASPPENISEDLSPKSPEPDVASPQPARRSSTSSSSFSPSEPAAQQSRSPPASMPLPSAPRRSGPPRKKSAKSPEASSPAVLGEQIVVSPEIVPTLDKEEGLDTPTILAANLERVTAGDREKEVDEVGGGELASLIKETSKDDAPPAIAADLTTKESDGGEPLAHEIEEPHDVNTNNDKFESKSTSIPAEDSNLDPADTQTSTVHEELKLVGQQGSLPRADDEPEEHFTGEPEETEEDEETARRQRIAEKLAKMGGVNPLGLPLQRKPSASPEDVQLSPTFPKRNSVGSPPVSPPPRKQSTRKPSTDIIPTSDPLVPEKSPQTTANESVSPQALTESPTRSMSVDDSKQNRESVATAAIPEEEARDSDTEEAHESGVAGQGESKTQHRKSATPEAPVVEVKDSAEVSSEDVSDVENELPPPPPPVLNLATRPVATPSVPVDPALQVQQVPSATFVEPAPPSVLPLTRSMPPPRLVPQPPESEEADDTDSNYSPTPQLHSSQILSDDEGYEDDELRRLPPRTVSAGGSVDDESLPLPVPNRRSLQADGDRVSDEQEHSLPPLRSIPPPPPIFPTVISDEQDSDYDEALPTRPLHRSVTPGTPPTNEIPLIVPPPTSGDAPQRTEPSPLRQSFAPPGKMGASSLSSGEPSPSHLSPNMSISDQEVLDEEEGDPIDPSFHSPSRRTSTIAALPNPSPPQPTVEPEEDEQAVRRRTIAERMAKLGGIKFGAAPLPTPARAIPKPREEEEGEDSNVNDQPPVEASEEEEERARKERIAAKLAGMGGMRIGMLPPGFGPARPSAPRATEPAAEVQPSRALPPSRPPPPPAANDSDADPESSLSASQQSLATSEEAVKVEAEESEIEEVSHADAVEPEQEELPPPVPTRGPRRRATGSESEQSSPKVPAARPPVPTTVPARRPSTQTITSTTRKSSADSSYSIQHKASAYKPQSEYVMVEEPSGFVPDDEDLPPAPPSRPSSRPPPRAVPPPPPPPGAAPPIDNISSQWELPSIPTSSLEFSSATDLSLSWPSDANPPQAHPPSSEKAPAQQTVPAPDLHLSSDELIAIWGRVGVQICEVATTLFEKSKKSLIGDGSYDGFIRTALNEVPNALLPSSPTSPTSYGYLVYSQTSSSVQKRVSDIMPGDVMVLQDAKLKGHRGLQTYHQTVGVGEQLVGIVSEFEPKKSKVRVFQANQHVGQQTVEAVSYRLEDLKSGTVKVYRVLES